MFIASKSYWNYKREKKEINFIKTVNSIKYRERIQLVNYISSELHDNISQMISLAIMNLSSIVEIENKNKSNNNSLMLLNKALEDIRYLIKTIKLRESNNQELDMQIDELISILNIATSIKYIKTGIAPSLDKERNYLILRIIQELLNNILKYSYAENVWLSVDNSDISAIQFFINHDGIKFKPTIVDFQKGLGLTNIVENTKLLKGDLRFEYQRYNNVLKIPTKNTY